MPKLSLTLGVVSTLLASSLLLPLTTAAQTPRQERVDQRIENREELQQDRQETRTDIQENRQEMRDNVQDTMQQRRSTIAQSHAYRLERRFQYYTDSLTKFADRLDAKIAEMSQNGTDTSEAKADIATARSLIASASDKGAKAVAQFEAVDPDKYEEQRDQALAARDLAMAARADFQSALQSLRSATTTLIQAAQ